MRITTPSSPVIAAANAKSAAATATTNATSTATTANSTLSETQFLQLLTQQLENQDPLQPEDDTQFLSQMAQFTALQETNTLNQQIQNLTASSYIGSTVTVNPGNSSPVTGVVTGVDTSGTLPALVINGSEYPLAQLQMVDPTTTSGSSASGSSTSSAAPTTSSPAATAVKAVTALLTPQS
jgi:flagellar basal-body rod modification protein FlgD